MKKTISNILLPFAVVVGGSNLLWAPPTPIWQVVGSAGFGGTGFNAGAKGLTMALDSNSIPYVAFSDNGDSTKAFVMKYNGSTWNKLGSNLPAYLDTAGTSIAINSSNTPYVAYVAPDSSYENYWVRVAKYNGSIWVDVGGTGFGTGASTHLTIDSSGTPLVAFRDADNDYDGTVKTFNGSSWSTVGSPGFISSPAVVTDSQNTPYVVAEYAAIVKKFDGMSWVTVGNEDFAPGTAGQCSIALNSKDEPYIAFVDGDSSDKISVMKFNGSDWVLVGTQGFSLTTTWYGTSIAIDSSDTPYVAYSDYDGSTHEAMVMKFNGSDWVVVGEARFSAEDALDISLAINKKGVPYVSYRDGNIYNRATVMYAPMVTCSYIDQGTADKCIPGTHTPDPGPYPTLVTRNYVQGNINLAGSRTADAGWEGEYPTLCRDEDSQQGSDNCPK